MSDLVIFFSGSFMSLSLIQVSFILIEGVLSPSWIQVSFILIEGVLSPNWIQFFFIMIEGVCLLDEFYGL